MELRLLPEFIDDPVYALRKAFGVFYENPAALITALGTLFFPYLIVFSQENYGNLVMFAVIMVFAPVILSGLMWQLVVGTSFKTLHTDFIDGLKTNYKKMGIAYLLGTGAFVVLIQVFVVLVTLFFGFDSPGSNIGLSENAHEFLTVMHFFGVVIGFTVLISIFQFFDVILITEDDTGVLEAYKKSYKLFRAEPLNVFMYMAIRGALFFITVGSPILLLVVGLNNTFIFGSALIATLILFPSFVILAVAYHIEYYNRRTEYIDLSDGSKTNNGDDEGITQRLKSALRRLKSPN